MRVRYTSYSSGNGAIASLVFGAFGILLGLIAALKFALPAIEEGKASLQWPTVQGRIVSAKVIEREQRRRYNYGSREPYEEQTMYAPHITYTYAVAGKTYTSDRLEFGGDFSSSSSTYAHTMVDTYLPGTPVEVYYNPNSPASAVLQNGIPDSMYWIYWGGIILAAIASIFLIRGLVKLGAKAMAFMSPQ